MRATDIPYQSLDQVDYAYLEAAGKQGSKPEGYEKQHVQTMPSAWYLRVWNAIAKSRIGQALHMKVRVKILFAEDKMTAKMTASQFRDVRVSETYQKTLVMLKERTDYTQAKAQISQCSIERVRMACMQELRQARKDQAATLAEYQLGLSTEPHEQITGAYKAQIQHATQMTALPAVLTWCKDLGIGGEALAAVDMQLNSGINGAVEAAQRSFEELTEAAPFFGVLIGLSEQQRDAIEQTLRDLQVKVQRQHQIAEDIGEETDQTTLDQQDPIMRAPVVGYAEAMGRLLQATSVEQVEQLCEWVEGLIHHCPEIAEKMDQQLTANLEGDQMADYEQDRCYVIGQIVQEWGNDLADELLDALTDVNALDLKRDLRALKRFKFDGNSKVEDVRQHINKLAKAAAQADELLRPDYDRTGDLTDHIDRMIVLGSMFAGQVQARLAEARASLEAAKEDLQAFMGEASEISDTEFAEEWIEWCDEQLGELAALPAPGDMQVKQIGRLFVGDEGLDEQLDAMYEELGELAGVES